MKRINPDSFDKMLKYIENIKSIGRSTWEDAAKQAVKTGKKEDILVAKGHLDVVEWNEYNSNQLRDRLCELWPWEKEK